ncbi:MAG: DegT/DnrJ/EryC1/StrS family aminotransferase [Deltaproteobacteria bacterium]|nr:DegT/DnrJ/EryC1/StrS family aminotransferase [Deltaproteobacteria bacterium]
MVPYVNLAEQNRPLTSQLLEATERVLRHGQYVLGPEVSAFEKRLAARLDVPHVVGVSSGTDALVMGLKVAGVEAGDEVITVSHTFIATASAIHLVGARVVFVDVDPRTMLLDPERLESALTSKTRAIIVVHLNGYPAEMEPIARFAKAHGLRLIEDCAQSFGACYDGRALGSWDIGCFSFHPLKVLGAVGDAGAVSVRDANEDARLRKMRNLGLLDRDHCVFPSGNSRLDTLQAAYLLVKLELVESWRRERAAHAAAYRAALSGRVELPPEEDARHEATWTAFVIRHPERDELIAELSRRGVDAKIHYPLAAHQHPAFAALELRHPLPVTEKVVNEILSLPITPEVSLEGRQRVLTALTESLDELDRSRSSRVHA